MSVESKAKINIEVNWSHVVSVESKCGGLQQPRRSPHS